MYYIAWLNGCSVARGTEADVRAKAIAIFNTPLWQQTVTKHGKPTELRITSGARQTLVSSETLCPPHRLVGAGDYGGTEVGMMCGDCGIDAGDIEDEPETEESEAEQARRGR